MVTYAPYFVDDRFRVRLVNAGHKLLPLSPLKMLLLYRGCVIVTYCVVIRVLREKVMQFRATSGVRVCDTKLLTTLASSLSQRKRRFPDAIIRNFLTINYSKAIELLTRRWREHEVARASLTSAFDVYMSFKNTNKRELMKTCLFL